jgi:WD40 repeat protein
LFLAAALTSVYAVGAPEAALEQRNIALAQSVISQADALRTNDPVLAAQFRLAAYRIVANPATTGSLLSTFAEPYSGRLVGHTKRVNNIAISADDRLLATASEDTTVRLWDFTTPETPRQLAKLELGEPPNTVSFSPDNKFLVIGMYIKQAVRIWAITDPSRPESVATLPGVAARWSPDGRLLAVSPHLGASEVQLWNVADPGKPAQLGSFAGSDLPAFTPDSRVLAVDPAPGGSMLWDVSNPAAPQPLEAPFPSSDDKHMVDISPDGKVLAFSVHSGGRTTQLWDISNPGNAGNSRRSSTRKETTNCVSRCRPSAPTAGR